ncbi:MAG: HemK family protein methyltransferase [Clostridia bacterium]|nr:HemK family protein methyltransferase [Clostridia bacterium]
MSSLKNILKNLNPVLQKQAFSLLAKQLNVDLTYLLARPELEISGADYSLFLESITKLQNDYPLAYIQQEQYFYARKFMVNEDVLIPRPESEEIINIVLKKSSASESEKIFIDLGTGSGALIISLTKELDQKFSHIYHNSIFLATDISVNSLKIAQANAKNLQVEKKIIFKSGNLLDPIWLKIVSSSDKEIYIMANLPYLSPEERFKEPSIRFEPDLALLGGLDGLDLYRQLITNMKTIPTSYQLYLIMEINPQQTSKLSEFISQALPLVKIEKKPDLSGQVRFLVVSNF